MTAVQRAETWYEQSAPRLPQRPALVQDLSVDVAVVGAGYTGLSAALALAEAGARVAVIEGTRVGAGASGRNGGQIVSGYNRSQTEIAGLVGADGAAALWDLAETAKAELARRIRDEAIECDLKPGYLIAALKPRHLRDLGALGQEWRAHGLRDTALLDRTAVQAMVAAPGYCGGLFDPTGGHLHPLRYAQGLAAAAERRGVRIFEGSPVIALDPGERPWLRTAAATVRADHLVLAGNAQHGDLVPGLGALIAPVATYIGATPPLEPARLAALMPADIAVADANTVLNYFRRSPDHRLLFGAGVSYSGRDPVDLDRQMRRAMARVFPDLAGVGFDWLWGGMIDLSLNRLPQLGRIGARAWYAQGFSGHGVALTGIAGRLIAAAIRGEAAGLDHYLAIPHRSFPGGRWRRSLLALGMLWYRLRDRL